MTIKNYSYGSGRYEFNKTEIDTITDDFNKLRAQVTDAPGSIEQGAAGAIYQDILDDIGITTYEPSVPQTVVKPKPGVDPAVFNWVYAAVGINGGASAAGDLVANYTNAVSQIRGTPIVGNQIYLASAKIGLAVANGIIQTKELPDIVGLGAADAGSTAATLFSNIYSPWAGTALFSFFAAPAYSGGAPFYSDWLLTGDAVTGTAPNYSLEAGSGGQTIFKQYTGTYELISTLEAYKKVSFWTYINTLLTGTAAGGQADPSRLASQTQNFLWTYYGRTSTDFPTLGLGAPFGPSALLPVQYDAGTVAGKTINVDANDQVVVGGPNDDTVVVSQPYAYPTNQGDAARLLDGGLGSNTLTYNGDNNIRVELQKVQRSASADDPTYTGAPNTVLKVQSSSASKPDYAYNFQTFNLGAGKDTFSIGAGVTKDDLLNEDGTPVIKSIDGGGGSNTLDLSNLDTALQLAITSLPQGYNGTGTSPAATISGLTGTSYNLAATSFQHIDLGDGNDTVQIDSNLDTPNPLVVQGGGGTNAFTAGGGTEILIGGSGQNSFHIENTTGTNAIDVVWGGGGQSAYYLNGAINVCAVNIRGATAESISALNPADLYKMSGLDPSLCDGSTTVFVVNPGESDTLSYGGIKINGSVDTPKNDDYYQVAVESDRTFYDPDWDVAPYHIWQVYSPKYIGSAYTYYYLDQYNRVQPTKVGDAADVIVGGEPYPGHVVGIAHFVHEDFPHSTPEAGLDVEKENFSRSRSDGSVLDSFYRIGTAPSSSYDSHYGSTMKIQKFYQGEFGIKVSQTANPDGYVESFFGEDDGKAFLRSLGAEQAYGKDPYLPSLPPYPTDSNLGVYTYSDSGQKNTIDVHQSPDPGIIDPSFYNYKGTSPFSIPGTPGAGSPGPDLMTGAPTATSFDGLGAPTGSEDYAHGVSGADTFVFKAGYGHLEISEDVGTSATSSSTSTLQIGADISPDSVVVTADTSGNIVLSDGIAGDRVQLDGLVTATGQEQSAQHGISQVSFADGTVWTRLDLLGLATTGTAGADDLEGPIVNDATVASVFDGKGAPAGSQDYENGNGGADTFIYRAGYGQLEIDQQDSSGNPASTLALHGIDFNQVRVSGEYSAVILTDGISGDQVKLDNQLARIASSSTVYGVGSVVFDDGTTWTAAQLAAMEMTGTPDADTLYGAADGGVFDGKGAPAGSQDLASGRGGGYTTMYQPGYGQLEINQQRYSSRPDNILRLGAGIAPMDLSVVTSGWYDISLLDGIKGDTINLHYMQLGYGYGAQRVQFADGTSWSGDQLNFLATNGTTSADTIQGTAGNDLLDGRGGSDTISGGGGYDTYFMRQGYGTLTVDNAAPGSTAAQGEVNFGPGITEQNLWFSQSGDDLVASVLGSADAVDVKGWFGANPSAQLAGFKAFDGLRLDGQVGQLTTAMASYAGSNPGFDPATATALPDDPALRSALATAWHS